MVDELLEDAHPVILHVQPVVAVEVGRALIAHEHGGQRSDVQADGVDGLVRIDLLAIGLFVLPVEQEGAVVPLGQGVRHLEEDAQVLRRVLPVVGEEELAHVHDARHDVGRDRLLDLAVVKEEGQGLAGVVGPAHLRDHGEVRADVVPEPVPRLEVEVDHLLDVEDLVLDVVDEVAQGLVLFAVVDGGDHVVVVPAPVFVPGQLVAQHAAVALHGEVFVDVFEVFALQVHALDHAGHLLAAGKLRIPQGERELVRDDLPAHLTVEGEGVGAEEGDELPLLAHVLEAFAHQAVGKAAPRVLRIGRHPRDAAHLQDLALDVDLHGVDHDLGGELVAVEPAQHISLREHGQLFALDFLFRPAGLDHLGRGDLEGVAQERVELLQIALVQLAHRKTVVALHNSSPFAGKRSLLFFQSIPQRPAPWQGRIRPAGHEAGFINKIICIFPEKARFLG